MRSSMETLDVGTAVTAGQALDAALASAAGGDIKVDGVDIDID